MRADSQLQHTRLRSRHLEIHPPELDVERKRLLGRFERGAREKKTEKRVKVKKERRRVRRRRRRRSAEEWSARWCTSIPSTRLSSLSPSSSSLLLFSRPRSSLAPSRAFAVAAAATTHWSRDEKCYVTTVAGWIGWVECIFHPSPPSSSYRRRHRLVFRLIPTLLFLFRGFVCNAHVLVRSNRSLSDANAFCNFSVSIEAVCQRSFSPFSLQK